MNKIILSLFGVIFIRIFLETFSSPLPNGYLLPWEESLLHIPLYYFSTFFSFALLLYFFTKDPAYKIFTFLTKVFIIMWLAPIADLIITQGQGSQIGFVITEAKKIPQLFFKLMDPLGYAGVTFGLHFASYILISTFAFYIYTRTRSFLKVTLGVFSFYSVLFFYAIVPSLTVLPQTLFNEFPSAVYAYKMVLTQSWANITQENFIANTDIFNQQLFLNNIFVSHVFFILLTSQLLMTVFIFNKKIWGCLRKSLRFERVFNYMLLAGIGIIISGNLSGDLNLQNLANIFSLATFLMLIILNSLLAVFINDEEDVNIDMISHPDRPLITKEVSLAEWKKMKIITLALLVFGTATLNKTAAFFLILAQTTYYIYSAKPLRLKRHFLSASTLIGLVTIFITMSGFFLVSPDQHLSFFPLKAMIIIGISQALISNMKDIKDFAGDRVERIRTIPVVFGLEKSKHIIAAFFASSFLLVPLSLHLYNLILVSIFCGLFVFYLLTKKQYQEKYIFLVLFLYMFTIFLSY